MKKKMMNNTPDWTSKPGDTILDAMEEKGITIS